MTETFVVAGAVAVAIGGVRWLRVAQREHYLAPLVTRFALRWWMSTPANRLILGIAVIGAVGVWWEPLLGWLGLLVAVGPLGLTIRGRSSPLRWTWRLRRVAVSAGVLVLVSVIGSLLMEHPGVLSVTVVLLPAVIDLVLMVLAPIERAIGERWVRLASAKLASSGAKVVAITGSYGKTTTKGYVAHLLAGTHSAVSTPASFNNRMGLARAINEHLTAGASVFVAEMGTYGKGEIADLCEFVPPDVAAITSIGPVHLERFGSEAAIVEAKGEILHRAEVAILNIDHPLLSELANQHQIDREVMRVSAFDPGADVSVIEGVVRAGGEEIGRSGPGVFAANLAAAVAVALALDVPTGDIARRIPGLPVVPHRRQISTSERGFVVIDDTYNSNPAGAAAALESLVSQPVDGRRVVVTPGMVELGQRQRAENSAFARAAAAQISDFVVVGLTNRRALVDGAGSGRAAVTVVGSREDAVAWVRSHLGPGDAVLYENDLPDHYP